eukprot:TRINITY_DN20746_c0_g1_i1.p1 TRINITY_DN20746_c0_g1~~TRINITY_DN20746_c0_g1_i1.p1  ORF type:complete len:352 (+),score=69.04 TRINITY_DN20746_c0_g1_i1:58-1056(+)
MGALRKVRFGSVDESFGESGYIQQMEKRGDLVREHRFDELRKSIDEDGYAYLNGVLEREAVLECREFILQKFSDAGGIIKGKATDAVLEENCGVGCIPFLEGYNEFTHNEKVIKILESPVIRNIFENVFGQKVIAFDYKWLRGVSTGSYTGAHYDIVYMRRGSPQLMTCWIPLGDITMDLGALAMCRGSHKLPSFDKLKATYGAIDHEKDRLDGTGWFSMEPREITSEFGGQWTCTDYSAGDIIIFGMHTLHMSTTNVTDKVRLSCDSRWQPSDDQKDPRYVGNMDEIKTMLTGMRRSGAHVDTENDNTETVTMTQLREKWGYPVPEGSKIR